MFLQMECPSTEWSLPQISSRTGEASSHRLGSFSTPCQGCAYPSRLDSPRTGLCSSFRWFTPRPAPNRPATPQNKVALALRLVTSVPLDEPPKC